MKKRIIALTGPTAGGKTTLRDHLLLKFEMLLASISATNRSPRPGEQDGVDYHFLTTEIFEKRAKKGEFLEWEEVYKGIKYGTLASEISRIKKMQKIPTLVIDVDGAMSIKKLYGDDVLIIFISPKSKKTIIERLRARGTETEESIVKRIARIDYELSLKNSFDGLVINDSKQKAKIDIERMFKKHFL